MKYLRIQKMLMLEACITSCFLGLIMHKILNYSDILKAFIEKGVTHYKVMFTFPNKTYS